MNGILTPVNVIVTKKSAVSIKKKETALVLAGGGGKGAFQIGAWQKLEELNLLKNVTAMAGTSVGALNAILFALDDRKNALKIWKSINPKTLLSPDWIAVVEKFSLLAKSALFDRDLFTIIANFKQLLKRGIFSREGLEEIFDSLPLEKILRSKKKIFVGVTSAKVLRKFETTYHELQKCNSVEELKENLLASSALPLAYSNVKVRNSEYADGGIRTRGNIPIEKVYYEGYRNIIVVALDNSLKSSTLRRKYSGCKFDIIQPKKSLGGIFKGTLNFSPKKIIENIKECECGVHMKLTT